MCQTHTHTLFFFGFSTLGCRSNASISLSLFFRNGRQWTSCKVYFWSLGFVRVPLVLMSQSGSQTEQSDPKRSPFAAAHGVKLRQRHAEDFFRLVIVPWPNRPSHVRQCGNYTRSCEHHEQTHTNYIYISLSLSLSIYLRVTTCIPIHLSIYLDDAELLVRDTCQCNTRLRHETV